MNTSTPIQVVHEGIAITYDEGENKWTFTLRGRDRSAESLAKAKEYIDKPLPPEKAKPFEKIPAWYFPYQQNPRRVEVTGIAEGRYSGDQQVWITVGGKRSKERVRFYIFPSNKKNDDLVDQILVKEKEVSDAQKVINELKENLEPLVFSKDE